MNPNPSPAPIHFAALTRAGEGLTQWRAMLVGFVAFVLAAVVFVAGAWLGSVIGGTTGRVAFSIFSLLTVLVMMGGYSAVGVMLMDKALNAPVRSIADAVVFGLLCIPKVLLLALMVLAAILVFLLVATVVYFVCKIPVLGAVVAFIAHPILVLIAAAALVALIWVIYPLFMPAIWSGLSFKKALASVLGIARKRLVPVVVMELALYVIMWVIFMLLFTGLFPASAVLTSMAGGIIGSNAMAAMAYSGNPSYALMNTGSANLLGLMGGLGLLYCAVSVLMAQVMIMGLNLVYLQAQEGLDAAEAEGALDDLIGDVRKRAEQAKERAVAAAGQARERAAAVAEQMQQARAAKAAEQEAARLKAEQEAAEQEAAARQEATRLQAEAGTGAETARAEAQEQEQEQAQAARVPEQIPPPLADDVAPAPTQQPPTLSCPGCHEAVTAGDKFCGNCGHRLG